MFHRGISRYSIRSPTVGRFPGNVPRQVHEQCIRIGDGGLLQGLLFRGTRVEMRNQVRHRLPAILLAGAVILAPGASVARSHCHGEDDAGALAHAAPQHAGNHAPAAEKPGLASPELGSCCVDPPVIALAPAILPAPPNLRAHQGAQSQAPAFRGIALPHIAYLTEIIPSKSPPGSPRPKNLLNSVFLI